MRTIAGRADRAEGLPMLIPADDPPPQSRFRMEPGPSPGVDFWEVPRLQFFQAGLMSPDVFSIRRVGFGISEHNLAVSLARLLPLGLDGLPLGQVSRDWTEGCDPIREGFLHQGTDVLYADDRV